MKSNKQLYSIRHILSGIFSMLVLAWLTVCLPYVNEAQQAAKNKIEKLGEGKSADNSNPLNNTTEEKSESGTSLLSEYLHEMPVLEHHFTVVSVYFKCHPSDLYLAFHPELLTPPPKA